MRRVRGDGVDLAVWERGPRDAPTVVLVHGYPDTHEVWDGVAALLEDRFHVVCYDVRGAGDSGAPADRAGYHLRHLAADLRAVLAATAGGKPAYLVGHDWGAMQAWELVTDDDAAGLVAGFTAISGPCLDHVGAWMRHGGSPAAQVARSWYIALFQLPFVPELAWRTGFARRLLRRLEPFAWSSPTLVADGTRGVELYRANILERMRAPRERRTAVPVQVVIPRGDKYATRDVALTAAPYCPELYVRELEGGHWIVRGHPERIARLVAELVDRPPALRRARHTDAPRVDEGRLVVVTGGGSGIGRATALAFAERGAKIVVGDKDREGAERTAVLCRLLGVEATALNVDVSDAAAMTRFAADVERDHGVPDVLVNNAGIGMHGGLLDTSAADWERVLGVNLWGVLHGCRLFGAQMVARGAGGHIVNLASAAAFAPSVALPAYATSKAAVLMLTECLRAELAAHHIGVSAICPGIVDTPITQATTFVGVSADEQARRRRVSAKLYRRRGVGPEAVARAIVRAVAGNTPVVPVAAEAHAARFMGRFAPGLVRRLAQVDPIRADRRGRGDVWSAPALFWGREDVASSPRRR